MCDQIKKLKKALKVDQKKSDKTDTEESVEEVD